MLSIYELPGDDEEEGVLADPVPGQSTYRATAVSHLECRPYTSQWYPGPLRDSGASVWTPGCGAREAGLVRGTACDSCQVTCHLTRHSN